MAKDEDKSAVGYKKPPAETRFKPGESGNAAGRPRGARGRQKILEEIAAETHRVKMGGEVVEAKYVDLLFYRLRELALQGNEQAMTAYEDWLTRLEAEATGKWTFGLVVSDGTTRETTPLLIEDVEEDPI